MTMDFVGYVIAGAVILIIARSGSAAH